MKKYTCILGLLMLTGRLVAQCPINAATPFDPARGGTLTTSGAFIFSSPGSLYVQDGGLDNGDGGTLEINGDVYINGDLRLSNNSNIVINSPGRLFVYGNVYINSGSTLTVNSGGNFYFYGSEWINQPGAVINNTGGEGTITFIQPLPAPGATDPVSGSARYPDNATAYTSTGNTVQYVDGGGVDMDVNMTSFNANNLALCNLDNSAAAGSGDTRLSGTLTFAANEGDVLLNDNNFILSATGNYAHSGINAYDGYFVTNGTGELQKEGLASAASFTLPVGQTENDYTPATITNTSGVANDYHVLVKTYAASGSVEGAAAEGIDRTWQVYSTSGGTANVCLQHNTATNAAGTATNGSSYDNTMGFVTQQTGTGVWSTGTQTDGGTPTSTHCGSYTLATASTSVNSYFSKSSDPVTPLPVTLTKFNCTAINCTARLQWQTTSEVNSSRYVVQHSINGTDFVSVAELPARGLANDASYEYLYPGIQPGINYFRLLMIDNNGDYEYSQVISLRSDCEGSITIAPNPVQDVLTIRGLTSGRQVTVFNVAGQQVFSTQSSSSILHMGTKNWTKGLYLVMITAHGKIIKAEKIIKQ